MKRKRPAKKKLVLVDVENCCGTPILTAERVAKTREALLSRQVFNDGDLVIVGTSHPSNMFAAKAGWSDSRCVMKRGRNGGDLAIIEAAKSHLDNIDSFSEVVLLSGDGIFTNLVRDISLKGIRVTVASRIDSLNESLARQASCLSLLNCPS